MTAVTSGNIPVGITDFEKLRNMNAVYIDKTSFLNSLLTSSIEVFLLLRPRRFGKTLSMSMLSTFLEMNYENPEDRSRQENLFKDLKVFKENRKLCDEYMGRYPVISLSLKDTEGANFEEAAYRVIAIFAGLARKFNFLRKNKDLDTLFLKRIQDFNNNTKPVFKRDGTMHGDAASLINDFLKRLAECLRLAYQKKVIVIIDEYDVPLQKATVHGYYDSMLILIRGILSTTLKDNQNIFKGYVTGCLRIAHQSIFTGVNNFDCYGLNDTPYARFIGLTKDETAKLLKDCGMENRLPDVISWYDGYNLAGNEMLCPWSVLKFLSRALAEGNDPATFQPENYWANSSGNDIIEICMRHPRASDSMRIQNLVDGNSEEITLREFTSYPRISAKSSFDLFGTLMLHTGYFTVVKGAVPKAANRAVIKIPNREIQQCFIEKAGEIFNQDNEEWYSQGLDLRDSLLEGDAAKAETTAKKMLELFVSVRDGAYESFYHGFLAGVLGMTGNSDISILSNRESGDGFSDVIIKNKAARIAAVLEFKKSGSDEPDVMDSICSRALRQIEDLAYDRELKKGYRVIHKYGIAFYNKTCRIIGA